MLELNLIEFLRNIDDLIITKKNIYIYKNKILDTNNTLFKLIISLEDRYKELLENEEAGGLYGLGLEVRMEILKCAYYSGKFKQITNELNFYIDAKKKLLYTPETNKERGEGYIKSAIRLAGDTNKNKIKLITNKLKKILTY